MVEVGLAIPWPGAMGDPVTIHAARTQLSRLAARAEAGEEIVIVRGDRPVAKPVPL